MACYCFSYQYSFDEDHKNQAEYFLCKLLKNLDVKTMIEMKYPKRTPNPPEDHWHKVSLDEWYKTHLENDIIHNNQLIYDLKHHWNETTEEMEIIKEENIDHDKINEYKKEIETAEEELHRLKWAKINWLRGE